MNIIDKLFLSNLVMAVCGYLFLTWVSDIQSFMNNKATWTYVFSFWICATMVTVPAFVIHLIIWRF